MFDYKQLGFANVSDIIGAIYYFATTAERQNTSTWFKGSINIPYSF